jgi:uncharacterized protein
MLPVKTTSVRNQSIRWLSQGISRNAAAVPLPPAFADAHRFFIYWALSCVNLCAHQPTGLSEKCQQQQSGKKLRTSEAFACEIWAHRAEPSVLPWRRYFAQIFGMNDLDTKPGSAPHAEAPRPEPSLDFSAASQPSYAHTLFFGPQGLRPGWGVAFYGLAFLLLQRLTNFCAAVWVHASPHMSMRFSEALFEFADLVAAFVPAVILAKIEKRPWAAYGFPLRRAFGRLFWLGVLWGFLGVSVLIFSLYGLHDFTFGRVVLHGVRIAKFAAYWSGMFLLVGFFEEFLFRGYTQFTLTRGLGFWPAAVLLSLSFGCVHLANEGERWPGALAAASIGLFFCLTLRRTGSLWFAVGFHAAWDWGESFFYSVPDSGLPAPGHLLSSSLHGSVWLTGGSVGPEGSLLCFLVIALVCVAFDRVFVETALP